VTLLTPRYGKLEVKAKGVRRAKSRMGGHLQPLTRVLVQLAQGRTRYVVAGCQALEGFPSLRADLDRLTLALYLCELADRLLVPGVEAQMPYAYLLESLRHLEEGRKPNLWARRLELALLRYSGYGPELQRCLACGRSLGPEGGAFSPLAGGLLCLPCGQGAAPISGPALRALSLLEDASAAELARLDFPPSVEHELEAHLRAYIVHVLEGQANTLDFLDKLRHVPLISGQR